MERMVPDPPRQAERPGVGELEAEAEVSPRDRAISPRFWAAYGTPLLRRLLNALREN